ncbi:MAG: hypothetical protein ABSA26_07395 [Thermoguttaceae bacterium]
MKVIDSTLILAFAEHKSHFPRHVASFLLTQTLNVDELFSNPVDELFSSLMNELSSSFMNELSSSLMNELSSSLMNELSSSPGVYAWD